MAGSGRRRLAAAVLQVLQLAQLRQRVVAQGLVQRRVAVLVGQVEAATLAHQQLQKRRKRQKKTKQQIKTKTRMNEARAVSDKTKNKKKTQTPITKLAGINRVAWPDWEREPSTCPEKS